MKKPIPAELLKSFVRLQGDSDFQRVTEWFRESLNHMANEMDIAQNDRELFGLQRARLELKQILNLADNAQEYLAKTGAPAQQRGNAP